MMPSVPAFIMRGSRQAASGQGALPIFLPLEILSVAGRAAQVIEAQPSSYLLQICRIGPETRRPRALKKDVEPDP